MYDTSLDILYREGDPSANLSVFIHNCPVYFIISFDMLILSALKIYN